MGYASGKMFFSDFEDLLKGVTRDMINSLVSKDFVHLSEDTGEFISVLRSIGEESEVPVPDEIIEMLGGDKPVYSMRYSRLQMPDKPPLFELFCPYTEEMLILILSDLIPKLANEISGGLSSRAKEAEAESKRRWREQNKPPCSEKHDGNCTDGCEFNKSGEIKI